MSGKKKFQTIKSNYPSDVLIASEIKSAFDSSWCHPSACPGGRPPSPGGGVEVEGGWWLLGGF